MSHAVCKTSATNLDPRFKTNSATSVLPSSLCSLPMQVTRYTISFFWLLQFGTFIRRDSFFMITIYVIFLPSTLAGFFIAICRVMTNRFRALTYGWMWFIGERCLRSFREPITEIRVSRTFNKLLALLGHIFPGTEIISVNVWKMNGYATAL